MQLRNPLSRASVYLAAVLAVVIIDFPLYWMTVSSFKSRADLYSQSPSLFPHPWSWQGYRDLFLQTNFLVYFKNSVIVAVAATALAVLVGSLAAYSLSRFGRFRFIAVFSTATLGAYMLPPVLLVLPLYVFIVNLGLADTLVALVITNTTFTLPLTIWFMRSYFNAIPVTLEESAQIDGCSRLQAMFRITMPLALPGLVSVGVFSFIHSWNEFLFALVFTSSELNKVLSIGFATWIGDDNLFSWGMLMAGSVLISLPVLVFYLLVQRNLVSGLAEGGLVE